MKFLFYGFRHYHIYDLFHKVQNTPGMEILAAVEEHEATRIDCEKNLNFKFDNGTYEEWLENPEVEAVAIGGAFGDRGQAIIKALQHGKHVISDKPICTRLEELEQIRTLSKEKNLQVHGMLDLKYSPTVLRFKELLDCGKYGQIRNISFSGQHYLNYGNRPDWYYEKDRQGGTINDLSIHGIDMLYYITGLSVAKVNAARTWNCFAHRHPDFKDCAIFMAEMSNHAGLLVDVSYSAPSQVFTMPTYWNFKFWCDGGVITFTSGGKVVTVYADGATEPEVFPGIEPKCNMLETFVNAVNTGSRDITENDLFTAESTLRIQQAADSAI